MFKPKRLSPIKRAKYKKKLEDYESIQHSIIEITNDKVVMNKNVDYLQGFYDALDLSHARLKAVEKMSGISDACTKEFIESALNAINGSCTMTQLWIDKALYEMECHEASEHFEDYMNPPKTPCDYPDYEGHYSCPYDAQGGDDCRNWCGLGVDE